MRTHERASALRGLPHPLFTATAGAALGAGAALAPVQFGYAAGLVAAVCAWTLVLTSWRRATLAAVVYVPFAGAVTLALSSSAVALLFKDLLFLAPAYVLFGLALTRRTESLKGLPRAPGLFMAALALVALVQSLNPGVTDPLVALIGLKVWLFYLPLLFLGFALLRDRQDLLRLLRVLTVIALIPCAIGIAQLVFALVVGYRPAMETIYGDAAEHVTQRFTQFEVGEAGFLARFPSTFTFVTQYFGFTMAMMAPAYALTRFDRSPHWRALGRVALLLAIVAALSCGARSAFIYVPLMLGLIALIDSRGGGALATAAATITVLATALIALGVDIHALLGTVSELTWTYASDVAYGTLAGAIANWPLGEGTGMNTGPARYAFADPAAFRALENYYAKAVREFGILGLLVIAGLFASLLKSGFAARAQLTEARLRSVAAALLAFLVTIVLNSLKGWQIDLDPVNVYFWLFAGVLLKLPALVGVRANEG
jgi:hypothetical protein